MPTNVISARLFALASALLLFVLPIPKTIALRNILTLICLVLVALLWRATVKSRQAIAPGMKSLTFWLLALTAWLVSHALLISDESHWAFSEITTQWLPALIAAFFGGFVIILAREAGWGTQKALTAFVLVLLSQTVFSVLTCLPEFLASGSFPQGRTRWTAGKLEISFWNNIVLAFLSVDLLTRWRHRHAMLALPLPVSFLGLLVVLLANLAFGARHGIIGSIMLLVSITILVIWHERRAVGMSNATTFGFGVCALIAGMLWGSLQLDPRWQHFEESVRFAWQNEQREPWLHAEAVPPPPLPSGAPLDYSSYLRVSWIRAGLETIGQYPLGVGYGRSAFGHALRKTQETRLGHSHSGIIDWTIGTGIPGLILWTAFIMTLVWQGLKRHFDHNDGTGLVLVLLSAGFMGRMVLDSINRDHMLMVFFMATGLVMATSPTSPRN